MSGALTRAEDAHRDALAVVIAVHDLLEAVRAGQIVSAVDMDALKRIAKRSAAHAATTLVAVRRERMTDDRRVPSTLMGVTP